MARIILCASLMAFTVCAAWERPRAPSRTSVAEQTTRGMPCSVLRRRETFTFSFADALDT